MATDSILNAVTNFFGKAEKVTTTAIDAAGNVANNAVSAVGEVVTPVTNFATNAVHDTTNLLGGVVNAVGNAPAPISNFATNAVHDATNLAGSGIQAAGNMVASAFGTVGGTVTSFIDSKKDVKVASIQKEMHDKSQEAETERKRIQKEMDAKKEDSETERLRIREDSDTKRIEILENTKTKVIEAVKEAHSAQIEALKSAESDRKKYADERIARAEQEKRELREQLKVLTGQDKLIIIEQLDEIEKRIRIEQENDREAIKQFQAKLEAMHYKKDFEILQQTENIENLKQANPSYLIDDDSSSD